MYEYLRKCKLPQDVVDGLCQVLDGNGHANQATNAALIQQHCDAGQYLTQNEYESLQQEDMWMGAQTLANRLRLLGLKSMKETTKKLATALLLWFHFKRTKQIPQGDIAYVLSHHLSQCFLSSTVEVGENAESLAVYPENPGDLKKSHLDAVKLQVGHLQSLLVSTPPCFLVFAILFLSSFGISVLPIFWLLHSQWT